MKRYLHIDTCTDAIFYFVLVNGIIQANWIEADMDKCFVKRLAKRFPVPKEVETIHGKVEIIPVDKLDKETLYEVHI